MTSVPPERSGPERQPRDETAMIVRALAERGPFVRDTSLGGTDACADCGAWLAHPVGIEFDDAIAEGWYARAEHFLDDPSNHAPACLWRRAKALYSAPPAGAHSEADVAARIAADIAADSVS
jgi:hypothetical protein